MRLEIGGFLEQQHSTKAEPRDRIGLVNTSWHWNGVTAKWYRPVSMCFWGLWIFVMILADFKLFGMVGRRYLAVVGVWLLGFLLIGRISKWQMKRGTPESIDIDEGAENRRLVCYGDILELSRVRDLTGDAMEPFIIRLLYPSSTKKCIFIAIVIWILTCIVLSIADPPGGEQLPVLAAILGVFLYALIKPRYYRVSGGRFEILAFPVLGSKCRVIESVDLRRTQVECRYNKSVLWFRFGEDDDDKRELKVSLARLWFDKHEFVEAVFQAALCREPGPKLPEDRLLG